MTAQAAAIQTRRLSYALDRAAFGHVTREQVEAEIARTLAAIDKWRESVK